MTLSQAYLILGIPNNSCVKTAKKAFRKKASAYHPDRGGDPEKFREAREAYEFIKLYLTTGSTSSKSSTHTGSRKRYSGGRRNSQQKTHTNNSSNKQRQSTKPILEVQIGLSYNEFVMGHVVDVTSRYGGQILFHMRAGTRPGTIFKRRTEKCEIFATVTLIMNDGWFHAPSFGKTPYDLGKIISVHPDVLKLGGNLLIEHPSGRTFELQIPHNSVDIVRMPGLGLLTKQSIDIMSVDKQHYMADAYIKLVPSETAPNPHASVMKNLKNKFMRFMSKIYV